MEVSSYVLDGHLAIHCEFSVNSPLLLLLSKGERERTKMVRNNIIGSRPIINAFIHNNNFNFTTMAFQLGCC